MMAHAKWIAFGLTVYAISTLVSMAAMSVATGLLIVVLLTGFGGPRQYGRLLLAEWGYRPVRIFLGLSAALTVACAISLVGGALFPLSYGGRQAEVHFLKDMAKAWYLFWPFFLLPALRALNENERGTVLRGWLGAFALLSVLGLVQHFVGWPRPQVIPGSEPLRYHATLFLGHHLSVASIFIFPFFAALDMTWNRNGPALSRLPRWFLALATVAGGVTLLGTYSRILWVALPLGVLVWLVWALPRRYKIPAVIAVALAGAAVSQLPAVQLRLHTGEGVETRRLLWNANMEFFRARPLTGTGWHHNLELSGYYLMSTTTDWKYLFAGHAHNNAIEMLASTGILGALAWAAWVVAVFCFLIGPLRASPPVGFAHGLACTWLVFQLNGLTQVNFWESKVLHQIMWATAWSLFWATGSARLPVKLSLVGGTALKAEAPAS